MPETRRPFEDRLVIHRSTVYGRRVWSVLNGEHVMCRCDSPDDAELILSALATEAARWHDRKDGTR